ncbi:amino acid racemase [Hoeflea sp. WL0058]|uniref:Amino acid racemase n=2 Tax=Flavimaribacter sediminis TaxID=2865987 RepID=A0AAE3D207_9HYPH|nr:amino acid racemase [Flavimaribacter sediminis]
MSWRSTALYYRMLNEMSEARHGSLENTASIVVTLPFAPLVAAMERGDSDAVSSRIAEAASQLEAAGAGCVLLTAFTAHFAVDVVRDAISIPLIDVGDALAQVCRDRKLDRVGMLGTTYTLESGHVAGRLAANGIEALLPEPKLATRVNAMIQGELTRGSLSETGGGIFDEAVDHLAGRGAQAVALACTELPLLLPRTSQVPLIDGVEAHVAFALSAMEKKA